MSNRLIDWMRAEGLRRSVHAGTTLACRGSKVDAVLLVERGSVFLERYGSDGNVLPVSVCGNGTVVGLSAAILDQPHDSDATSRADGEVIAVAAASMRALTSTAELGLLVAQALAVEARVLAERCIALQSHTVRDRILVLLDTLCRDAVSYPVAVVLPMRDMAAMVAADQAHVCRVMRGLCQEGVVDYGKNRLRIRRPLCGSDGGTRTTRGMTLPRHAPSERVAAGGAVGRQQN
jgi:CRP-like cAMP-binding protein